MFLTLEHYVPRIVHTVNRDNYRDNPELVICELYMLIQKINNLTYKKILRAVKSSYFLTGTIVKYILQVFGSFLPPKHYFGGLFEHVVPKPRVEVGSSMTRGYVGWWLFHYSTSASKPIKRSIYLPHLRICCPCYCHRETYCKGDPLHLSKT